MSAITKIENNNVLSKSERMRLAMNNIALIRRERNDRSLYEFVKWGWSEVSLDKYEDNWHIPIICKELEKVAKRVGKGLPKKYDLIFNVPPGTSKTRVISMLFQVWCWTKWEWMSFITASHAMPLSIENADFARDLLKSEKFKEVYPELRIREDKDVKSNFKVVKVLDQIPGKQARVKNGGSRISTSVKGQGIGLHAHIQICDDLIDPKGVLSKAVIEAVNHFLDHVLSGRKTNKAVTPLILVMQRLSMNDPTAHLIAQKSNKIRVISLPGEIKNYRDFVRPKKLIKYYSKKGLLDPKRLGWKVLRQMEAKLGQYGYAGQVGQNPTPPGGGMFKVKKLMVITSPLNPANYVRTVRAWDKAGTLDGGAYTAGVKLSELTNGRWIVEDVVRMRVEYEEREELIKRTAQADGPEVEIVIEQEPGSGGKESAQASIKMLAGYSTYRDLPKGDKALRADPFSVQVNWGNIFLMKGDWNHDFIEEYRSFPFGNYKDQVDAGAMAFSRLTGTQEVERIT